MSDSPIIDWGAFERSRAELGAGFIRILGYFREDGIRSVAAIEEAMRSMNAVAMVIPAHTLKGEASQFGAEALGELAELIESGARHCVEVRTEPDELLPEIVKLRPLFNETLSAFERATNPLVVRRSFGKREVAVGNQGFGRI